MTRPSLLRHHLVSLGYRAWEHDGGVRGDGWSVRLDEAGPVVEGPVWVELAVAAWWEGVGR